MPIERRLASKMRRAAERLAECERERNLLMLEAREAGATFREIAHEVGLSHPTVAKVLRRLAGDDI